MASHTRIGLAPTRLPAGEARDRLLELAVRGVALCQRDRSRGARLVTYLCSTLAAALIDLNGAELRLRDAENRLGAAQRHVTALERQLVEARYAVRDPESFDVPTREVTAPDLLKLVRATPTPTTV